MSDSFSVLQNQFEGQYGCKLPESQISKLVGGNPKATSVQLLKAVLVHDLKEIVEVGSLPQNIASQPTAELKGDVLVQIESVRDVTQPLRPHADMDEDEAIWGAANQKNTAKRLLKLVVSDGQVEVPAIELKTLMDVFKKIPMPGEKLILKKGGEVKNGMFVMQSDTVCLQGGGVESMRNEFLIHRGAGRPSGPSKNPLGAPQFEPFVASKHYKPGQPTSSQTKQQLESHATDHARGKNDSTRSDQGRGSGPTSRSRGRGGDGTTRGRGRGSDVGKPAPKTEREHGGRGQGTRGGASSRGNDSSRGRGKQDQKHVDPAPKTTGSTLQAFQENFDYSLLQSVVPALQSVAPAAPLSRIVEVVRASNYDANEAAQTLLRMPNSGPSKSGPTLGSAHAPTRAENWKTSHQKTKAAAPAKPALESFPSL